jgi:hypothetical protein
MFPTSADVFANVGRRVASRAEPPGPVKRKVKQKVKWKVNTGLKQSPSHQEWCGRSGGRPRRAQAVEGAPYAGLFVAGCKEIRFGAGSRQIWSLRGMVRDRCRTVASGASAWSSVRAAVHGQHSTYTAVTGHSCMAWSLVGHQPQALGQQLTGWQWWREGGSFLGGCTCPECSRWAALPVAMPCAGHTRSQTNV